MVSRFSKHEAFYRMVSAILDFVPQVSMVVGLVDRFDIDYRCLFCPDQGSLDIFIDFNCHLPVFDTCFG
jgi:hypothetical protein